MAEISLYLDEDVHLFMASALRLRGWNALTTQGAAQRGAADLDQIRFASTEGRALLTYNVQDFPRLHYQLVSQGETHASIIVASQADPRRNVRALLRLLDRLSAETLHDNLLYLSNWF